MNIYEIILLLEESDIFSKVPAEVLKKIAGSLSTEIYKPDQRIITKGDSGSTMYIIARGNVKVHDEEYTVAQLHKGESLGIFSLLDDAPRSMSVTAIDETEVLCIERETLYKVMKDETEVTSKVIAALTGKLREQNASLINQFKTREEELTRLVNERTAELQTKNKEITDNVNYAKRIQSAILPDTDSIKQSFKDCFVLYMPKDIVSGDFYSFSQKGDRAIIAAGDCTGHGVTGAFLSLIGSFLINEIINQENITEPSLILDQLNEEIIEALKQKEGELNDGMDISVCTYDSTKSELRFSGANRPLWLIRDNELITYDANKFPVGGLQDYHGEKFKQHIIPLQEKDVVYIFTDGYADQFGGEHGKKLMTKKLKEVLLSIKDMSMNDQRLFLKDYLEKWKGNNDQVDDVLVIGMRF